MEGAWGCLTRGAAAADGGINGGASKKRGGEGEVPLENNEDGKEDGKEDEKEEHPKLCATVERTPWRTCGTELLGKVHSCGVVGVGVLACWRVGVGLRCFVPDLRRLATRMNTVDVQYCVLRCKERSLLQYLVPTLPGVPVIPRVLSI